MRAASFAEAFATAPVCAKCKVFDRAEFSRLTCASLTAVSRRPCMLRPRHTHVALMEDHMRKSIIPMAVAIVSALSLPAQAAKFNCTFYQNSNPVSSACPIDSAGTAKPCMHKYSATLFGTCTGAVAFLVPNSLLPTETSSARPIPALSRRGRDCSRERSLRQAQKGSWSDTKRTKACRK